METRWVARGRLSHSWALALPALVFLAGALGVLAGSPDPCADFDVLERSGPAFLAVGDGGKPSPLPRSLDPQHAVGRALAREAERSPVDALVLLGDNFYDHGLVAGGAERQIRDRLVAPYCRFVALSPDVATSWRRQCAPSGAAAPTRILAVLGNHDYGTPESPRLQRELVPLFVTNWRMPADLAEVVALAPDVSLILFDSERAHDGASLDALVGALREAPGPWRILVGHRPIRVEPEREDSRRIAEAIRRAGVPVQVVLAGHEHNLEVFVEAGVPGLHVIAGSGSRVSPLEGTGQAFARETLGFARFDWGRAPGDADVALHVSLFAAPRWPWEAQEPRMLARAVTGPTGGARLEWTCEGGGAGS